MNQTKIEWCDFTWNPVWGCRNNCPYCYARRLAHRFGESFEPHWKEKNFGRVMPKKPSRIFVNSMSDVCYWQRDWLDKVLQRIAENPQHTFLFLTKTPSAYWQSDFPGNCWLGVTATTVAEVIERQNDLIGPHTAFVSIEPMSECIPWDIIDINMVDWLIIGAETGNRMGKIIPKYNWIEELVQVDVPIFMKDSLQTIWGQNLIREWPRHI